MPDSATDRKSIRAKEKASAAALAQRHAFVRNMMSTIEGRAWFWHHLSSCHCFRTTFTSDTHITAFQEGQRSIGLALLDEVMQACPDQFITAMREANVRDTTAERRSSPQSDGRDSGARADQSGGDYIDNPEVWRDGPDYDHDLERWGYKPDPDEVH